MSSWFPYWQPTVIVKCCHLVWGSNNKIALVRVSWINREIDFSVSKEQPLQEMFLLKHAQAPIHPPVNHCKRSLHAKHAQAPIHPPARKHSWLNQPLAQENHSPKRTKSYRSPVVTSDMLLASSILVGSLGGGSLGRVVLLGDGLIWPPINSPRSQGPHYNTVSWLDNITIYSHVYLLSWTWRIFRDWL